MLDALIWSLILLLGLMIGIAPICFLVIYKTITENPRD
jgi:hypothetical protein